MTLSFSVWLGLTHRNQTDCSRVPFMSGTAAATISQYRAANVAFFGRYGDDGEMGSTNLTTGRCPPTRPSAAYEALM